MNTVELLLSFFIVTLCVSCHCQKEVNTHDVKIPGTRNVKHELIINLFLIKNLIALN